MFRLTATEAVLLAAAVIAITTALVAGALRAFRRTPRLVPARVTCPVLDRTVRAELVRDEWTRRFVHVARCEPLGGAAGTMCNQRCLEAPDTVALADAA